jgi:hypothetical protein
MPMSEEYSGSCVTLWSGRVGSTTVPQMMTIYKDLQPVVRQILRNAGTKDIYQAQVFSEIRLAAQQLASKQLGRH